MLGGIGNRISIMAIKIEENRILCICFFGFFYVIIRILLISIFNLAMDWIKLRLVVLEKERINGKINICIVEILN